MGWWETPEGLALGDGPLDELHRSLREVAASYTNALGRPPEVAELEHLLALVLDSLNPAEAGGLDGRTVTGVAVKTKKGARRVAAAVGDVFAVPLPDGTHGFGRIMHDDTRGTITVEFLSRRSNLPATGPDVADEPRLGPPAEVAVFYSVGNGRWPVLFSNEGFRAPDHDEIQFQFWSGGDHYSVFDIEGRTLLRDVSRSEVPEDLPYSDAYGGGAVEYPSVAEDDLAARLDAAGL